MKISVIVPVYNDWASFDELLNHLQAQNFNKSEWELLVVDNGSAHVPRFDIDLQHSALLQCETPGAYAARNEALKRARGELLVFTDADCRPVTNWLSHFWDQYQQDQASGETRLIAGGVRMTLNDPQQTTPAEVYDFIFGLPQERYVSKGYAVTANLAIPRKVIDEIGEFDSKNFSGGDYEICMRAGNAGYPLYYLAEASVSHPARRDLNELERKKRRTKGGQLQNVNMTFRLKYFVGSFLPPLRETRRAWKSEPLSKIQRKQAIKVAWRLWLVGIHELFRLLFGATPERR